MFVQRKHCKNISVHTAKNTIYTVQKHCKKQYVQYKKSESHADFSPSEKKNADEEHSRPRLFSLGLESVPRSESHADFSPSEKQNADEEHSHPRLFSLGLESVPR